MFNALLERRKAKIQNKPNRKIKHPQIGAALRGENRMQRTDCLQFYHNLVVDQQINSFWVVIILAEYIAFIHDRTRHLAMNYVTPMR